MTREEIFVKLKDIFKLVINNGVNVDNADTNTNIMLDLGVNSVGLIYVAIAIEQTFGIDMGEVTFSTFKIVDDVIDYIEERL